MIFAAAFRMAKPTRSRVSTSHLAQKLERSTTKTLKRSTNYSLLIKAHGINTDKYGSRRQLKGARHTVVDQHVLEHLTAYMITVD